jgi:lysyl-tRNA synthetase, class II
MARALRGSLVLLAGWATLLAATGWLYVLRPAHGAGGVSIREALPLDELSGRAGVPLATFLGVWGGAALIMGLLARSAGVERLTAALVLAAAVGTWQLLASGASLVVVRQIPAHDALDAAVRFRPIYAAALLAGLAGAICGRRRFSLRSRAPSLLAVGVAAAGTLGLIAAVFPLHHQSVVAVMPPSRLRPLTHALAAPLSVALLLAAKELARRKRRAWQVSLVLLGGAAVLHLLHGLDAGVALAGSLALALVACRHEFDVLGDPASRPRLAVQALLLGAGLFAYGAVLLWLNQLAIDRPYSLGFAARETGAALVGLRLGGSAHLTGSFGEWFPLSVFLGGLAACGWLLLGWFGPWRYRQREEARERRLAHDLVATWGADTLAPFVLRGDKSYFFSEDERSFIAYRVVGGVAIASGDPIGRAGQDGELLDSFISFVRERGWRLAVLGASERRLDLYRSRGLHALYHGDEAVVETARFSLEGRAIRKVRQSVHRLEREGYTAKALHPRELASDLRRELEAVAREWRGREPERGFVMALDTLFRLEDDEALFVVGFGPGGAAAGFLHFAVSKPGCALSLSSMPRLKSTPNGFNEWLVCAAVDWARANGFARISLNFAPFAALLAPEAELSALQRVERRALLSLKGHFQLDNLLRFNRKFAPSWQRRFVVYERRRDLPRVGIAALAAEAYLPFAGRRGE